MIKELRQLEDLVFKTNNLSIINVTEDKECKEYYGYSFQSKGHKIKFRKAKVTPKKSGQFVTL